MSKSIIIDMSDKDQGQSTEDGISFTLFIIGGTAVFITAITITIVAVSAGVCWKIKRVNGESIGTLTANNIKAHRIAFPGKSTHIVGSNSDSEMEQNEAYISRSITKTSEESVRMTGITSNEAHEMALLDTSVHIYTNSEVAGGIKMEQNEAYTTSIITERNNAYAVNMVVKVNEHEKEYY